MFTNIILRSASVHLTEDITHEGLRCSTVYIFFQFYSNFFTNIYTIILTVLSLENEKENIDFATKA